MIESEKETIRVEAFSDGVFAITITLLALDLKLPHPTGSTTNMGLWQMLMDKWTVYFAFVVSFGSILIMWVNHHRIFERIHKINRSILFANGFMLMMVVTVPFTTSVLADHYLTLAANTAAAIYSGSFVVINISYILLWRVASNNKVLLRHDVTEETVHQIHRNLIMGLPCYIAAFIAAFFSAGVSIAICMLLWLYWAFFQRAKPK